MSFWKKILKMKYKNEKLRIKIWKWCARRKESEVVEEIEKVEKKSENLEIRIIKEEKVENIKESQNANTIEIKLVKFELKIDKLGKMIRSEKENM